MKTLTEESKEKIELEKNTINLRDIILCIFQHKTLLFILLSLGVMFGSIYNVLVTPQYASLTTFFVEASVNQEGLSNRLLSQFGNGSKIDKILHSVLESYNIQTHITKDILNFFPTYYQPLFNEEKAKTVSEKLEFVNDDLDLNNKCKIRQDSNDLYHLTFEHSNKDIALAVTKKYLEKLLVLNLDLQISSKKDFIINLDAPRLINKGRTVKPKKIKNITISCILSLFIGFMMIGLKLRKSKIIDSA